MIQKELRKTSVFNQQLYPFVLNWFKVHYIYTHTHTHTQRGHDSSVGIWIRYGLDGPGIESRWGARFSATVQTGPGVHPASYTMGIGSFLGVKRPGHGIYHPPPSSAEVEGRVQLYICSPSGPSWPVLGRTLPLPFTYMCWLLHDFSDHCKNTVGWRTEFFWYEPIVITQFSTTQSLTRM